MSTAPAALNILADIRTAALAGAIGGADHRTATVAWTAPHVADLPASEAADVIVRAATAARALGWNRQGSFDPVKAERLTRGGAAALLEANGCAANPGALAFACRGGELFRALAALLSAPTGTPARTVLAGLKGCPRTRAALAGPVNVEPAAPAVEPAAPQAEEEETIVELPAAATGKASRKGKAKGASKGKGD